VRLVLGRVSEVFIKFSRHEAALLNAFWEKVGQKWEYKSQNRRKGSNKTLHLGMRHQGLSLSEPQATLTLLRWKLLSFPRSKESKQWCLLLAKVG
jgi:hypothetical protein